jgi:hypothetical protein
MSENNDLSEAGWYMLLTVFIMIWMIILLVFG